MALFTKLTIVCPFYYVELMQTYILSAQWPDIFKAQHEYWMRIARLQYREVKLFCHRIAFGKCALKIAIFHTSEVFDLDINHPLCSFFIITMASKRFAR